jgi:polysaccharide biosynthesis/export protein
MGKNTTTVCCFGLILFALFGAASWASAADDLQHRPRYTLRPGDVLDLEYRYTPEFNQSVTILPDGYVSLDVIGSVRLAGLTLDQAHDLIIQKARVRLRDPELNLVLKDFQAPYVAVAGEVGKPGKIELRENITAIQAILLCGGFLESARSSQVVLFRRISTDTAEVRILNLRKLKNTADLEHDVLLEPGDMLLVPRNKLEGLSRYMKLLNVGTYFNPAALTP